MAKYVIRSTNNNQFRWTFHANNGEIIMTSETFTAKQACKNGIASSKVCVNDKNFEKLTSISNQPYFNQIANNGEILATSEMYSSTYNRDNAIQVVKQQAPGAGVIDNT